MDGTETTFCSVLESLIGLREEGCCTLYLVSQYCIGYPTRHKRKVLMSDNPPYQTWHSQTNVTSVFLSMFSIMIGMQVPSTWKVGDAFMITRQRQQRVVKVFDNCHVLEPRLILSASTLPLHMLFPSRQNRGPYQILISRTHTFFIAHFSRTWLPLDRTPTRMIA